MSHLEPGPLERAEEYCQRRRLTIEKQFGAGADGLVLSTTRRTAVKVFRHEPLYLNELAVYQRLQELSIDRIDGFSVPRLIDSHDELWVIEMETVEPPFVVDFAEAYLDRRPPFSEEERAEWEADREELFGSDWPRVRSLLSAFRGMGIHLNDVKPGNITLR